MKISIFSTWRPDEPGGPWGPDGKARRFCLSGISPLTGFTFLLWPSSLWHLSQRSPLGPGNRRVSIVAKRVNYPCGYQIFAIVGRGRQFARQKHFYVRIKKILTHKQISSYSHHRHHHLQTDVANTASQTSCKAGESVSPWEFEERLPESKPSPCGLSFPQTDVANIASPTTCKSGESVLYWE